jgi:serine protease AprX
VRPPRQKEGVVRTNSGIDVKWQRLVCGALATTLAVTVAAMTPAAPNDSGVGSGGWAGNIWLGGASTATSVTLADVRKIIGADTGAAATLTGAGVGVALIDTGVASVPGLPATQVVNGPDLSFESQSASLRYLDTYGHGTHMAGIIVGNDTATGTKGIAPSAKLTSIKVGASNGAVDVSQIIAAVDWVVAHRNDDPANPIRVINLSYGTGGMPDYWTDPVQFAVEQAWKAGIVVVAAVGNSGGQMSDPATDQFVLNAGSASTRGTLSPTDDTISTFTSLTFSGGANRRTDVLAPGEAIVSLRDPGSNIDVTYAGARVGTNLFRGSGTSQAAAITSAAVALLLQARPSLTPDQVKNLLTYNGTILTAGNAAGAGYRELNVNLALAAATPTAKQTFGWSSGTGKLEAARGGTHVSDNGTLLSGERSIFGAFDSATWAAKSAAKTSWSGGLWMGYRFAGDGWTGSSWAAKTWASATWSGKPWGSSTSWTDPSWSGRSWSGRSWSAGSWVSQYWSSDDWAAAYWG